MKASKDDVYYLIHITTGRYVVYTLSHDASLTNTGTFHTPIVLHFLLGQFIATAFFDK